MKLEFSNIFLSCKYCVRMYNQVKVLKIDNEGAEMVRNKNGVVAPVVGCITSYRIGLKEELNECSNRRRYGMWRRATSYLFLNQVEIRPSCM